MVAHAFSLCSLCLLTSSSFAALVEIDNGGAVGNNTAEFHAAIKRAYEYFNETFNYTLLQHLQNDLIVGSSRYRRSKAQSAYMYVATGRPHCDKGDATPLQVSLDHTSVYEFPGGISTRNPPDFSNVMNQIASHSPSGGKTIAMHEAMADAAHQMGRGLVQAMAAAIVNVVPPLIPPPAWMNMPLPCAPMVTGHNCFGAVLYPITFADFLVADMTDKVMDGYLASFPDTYANKVGKTSDTLYKACASSYFSMQCSALFPRCTVPMSRDEAIPVGGRVPLCLNLCILPLVMCPGFWISDIIGSCSFVSVPPVCTMAFFWNHWRLPPQYESFDESHPFPHDCPDEDVDNNTNDVDIRVSESPIESEAKSIKIPPPRQ